MLNDRVRFKLPYVCGLSMAAIMASTLGAGSAQAFDIGALVKSAIQQHGDGSSLEGIIRSIAQASTGTPLTEADEEGDVVLYSRPSCGYCKQAKQYLSQHRIPYVERNIESSARNRAAYTQAGGKGVPHFVIGQQTMMGWSPTHFQSLYDAEGLPRRREQVQSDGGPAAGSDKPMASRRWLSGDVLVVKLGKVPLLAEPSGGAARRSVLAKNEEVVYAGEERDGFTRITTAEADGWVTTSLLTKR